MHVDTVDVHFCILYNAQDMRNLVNTNSKFTINMPHRNIAVTPCHYVWVDANAHWYFRVLRAKLFQERKVIYIQLNAQTHRLFNLTH